MQILWTDAGLTKTFGIFYLQTKVYTFSNFVSKKAKYKYETIMLQIFNAFCIYLMNKIDWEPLCKLAVLTYFVKIPVGVYKSWKFIPSILQAFLQRFFSLRGLVSNASIFQLQTVSLEQLCFSKMTLMWKAKTKK